MKCPKCNSELKEVPAGVSKKTGKPYNAFIACSNRECDYTKNITPTGARPTKQAPSQKEVEIAILWQTSGKIASHLCKDYDEWKIKTRAVHDFLYTQIHTDNNGEINVEDVPF